MGIIGLLAIGTRLAFGWEYAADPLGHYLWVDEGAYWFHARAIGRGALWPARPFYQDPLWPYLLAVLIRWRGEAPDQLRIVLAGLGSLAPLAITWAGWRGIGRAEGLLAGLLAAVCGPLIFTAALLEKEGLGVLLAAVALGLTASGTPSGAPRPRWQLATVTLAGIVWGLVSLVRANALLVAPVGVGWWLSGGPRRPTEAGWRERWRLAGGFLGGFALAVGPVIVVNRVVSTDHEWVGTTWQAGANFDLGNGPDATGTYQAPAFVRGNPAFEADDFTAEAEQRVGRRLSPGQVSRFWWGEGLRTWRDRPLASFWLLVRKVGFVCHRFEIPDNQSAEVVRLVAAPSLAWGVIGWGTLLPLAVLGLMATPRNEFLRFVAVVTALGLGSTACFFVVGRYRLPWVPGMTLLAAAGCCDLVRRFRTGASRGFWVRAGCLGGVGIILAWRPLADPVPDRWVHAEIAVAVANIEAHRLDPALDALDDGRALGVEPARHLADLLESGPLGPQLAALASTPPLGLAVAVERRERARRLRQFAAGRAASRAILDELLQTSPNDPATLRESAAWWLGAAETPGSRAEAVRLLSRAMRAGDREAAILATLMPDLPANLLPAGVPDTPRGRLARAVEVARNRRGGVGSGL